MVSRHYALSAANTVANTVIGLVGNVLLARILTPDDYGLIAMLAIFMAIAMNFTDSGLSDYLISKKNANDADFATVRTHNIVTAGVFYVILFLSSNSIAEFYGRPELRRILEVIALSIVFRALTLPEITRLRKSLMFGRIAVITTFGNALALVVAYCCAIGGLGYWALVVQSVAQAVSLCVLFYLANRKLPVIVFSKDRYKEMRKFGNNMLLSYITNQFGDNMAAAVIGKIYSAASLGAYGQAQKLSTTLFGSVNAVVLTTSYPLIAKEVSRNKRRKMYRETLDAFLFVHYAVLIPFIAAAPQIILVLLGSKWSASIPFLQLVLLSIFLQPLVTLNLNIAKTESHTHIYRNQTLLRNFLSLVFLVLLAKHSIIAIVAGQVVARLGSALVAVLVCGKLIAFRLSEQMKLVAFALVAPIGSTLVALLASSSCSREWEKLALFATVYIFAFIGFSLASRNKTMMFLVERARGG